MSIQISEVRHEELEAALAFAREGGSAVEAGQVWPRLSLLARDGAAIVGVALCVVVPGDGAVVELVVSGGLDPTHGRGLVDKALLKLRAEGLHTCRIHTHGPDGAADFWAAANWLTDPDAHAA